MARPRVSVFIAVTLDGYIARSDGSIDFLDAFHADASAAGDDADYGYGAFYASVDTLLVGRATWETVAAFPDWPWADRRVWVRTSRPLAATHGEVAFAGALGPALERLAADGARHVYLDGGQTVRDGLAEGVVDRMTLSTIPVLLGEGRPLFTPGLPASTWRRTALRGWENGLTQATWERTA